MEWASDTNTNFSDSLDSSFSAGTNGQFIGGGQIGVNYEFANGISVGAEAMFDWLSNSRNAIITATDPAGAVAANIGMRNARWLTTVSAASAMRGTGRWRQGRRRLGDDEHSTISVGHAGEFTSTSNTTSLGYTAGFGVEWAFASNWSVRGKSAYIGLPNHTLAVAPGNADVWRPRHHLQQLHFDGHRCS